jgi:hypothetical protein
MAFAQGSRSSLSYIVESTFGTTPSGNFISLPFSTHGINLSKDRVAGTDIQADRMPRHDRHGNKQVSGEIVADLREADFDPLLESVMLNAFSGNDLKVGTTPKFFSLEDYAADIDQSRVFTGCTVSTMGVSIAPNQMVTTTFGIVGKDMGISDAQKTLTAASNNAPFDAYSGSLSIGDTGGTPSASAIITGMEFTLNNSFAPTFVVGSDSAPQLEVGRAEVEGTMSAYFQDAALVNRFINETETELNVVVGDGTNTLAFNFPRAKINSADVGVDGPTSRVISMSFVALYDTTDTTNFTITRS